VNVSEPGVACDNFFDVLLVPKLMIQLAEASVMMTASLSACVWKPARSREGFKRMPMNCTLQGITGQFKGHPTQTYDVSVIVQRDEAKVEDAVIVGM